MERVPEHAVKFEKELTRGLNSAKTAGKDIATAKLAALVQGDDDES